MTKGYKEILSKLGSGEIKGVALELAPKLRNATKELGVQYFATILTLKGMGLSEDEAKIVAEEIVNSEFEKVETCYKDKLYEMANR